MLQLIRFLVINTLIGLIPQVVLGSTTWLAFGGEPPMQSEPPNQGIKVEYYRGTHFNEKLATRVEESVNYEWAHQKWLAGLDELNFSAKYSGRLMAPKSGEYDIIAWADDGVKLWLGGKLLLDEWHGQSVRKYSAKIKLQAGKFYDLRIEYFNHHGPGMMKLYWVLPEEGSQHVFDVFSEPEKTLISKKYFYRPASPPQAGPVVAQANTPPKEFPKAIPPKTTKGRVVKNETQPVAKPSIVKTVAQPSQPEPVAMGNRAEPNIPAEKPLAAPAVGKSIILNQVLFEQSKYMLLPASYAQLDQLVDMLRANPEVTIEVIGHTDNVGDPRLNQGLSEFRSQVVINYLIRQGIAANRLSAKGFGGTQPIAPNDVEEGRAKNRRVEFTVVKN